MKFNFFVSKVRCHLFLLLPDEQEQKQQDDCSLRISIGSLMATLIFINQIVLLKLIWSADTFFSTTLVTILRTSVNYISSKEEFSPSLSCWPVKSHSPSNISGYIVNALGSLPELVGEILLLKIPYTCFTEHANIKLHH